MSSMPIKQLTLHRLLKEEAQLERQPIPNALVKREGTLKFYFCLYNLQGSYAGGFYFGLLQLHENYPFNAPKLIFYTPSGRFETDLPICTSFTNYHQQTWTTAWNVRTLILATISFMYSEQPSYGCCHLSHQQRVKMAKQSMKFNMKNELFVKLFSQKLSEMNLLQRQMQAKVKQKQQNVSRREEADNNVMGQVAIARQDEQKRGQLIDNQLEEKRPQKKSWGLKQYSLMAIGLVGVVGVGIKIAIKLLK